MTRGRPPYDVLDHTADAGVLVRAPDAATLFERTAAAMFDLMVDVEAVAADLDAGAIVDEHDIEAGDREELLVAFLGELLSLALLEQVMLGAFEILELGERALRVRTWGVPLDAQRHGFKSELKAVTYHTLLVSEDADGWSARVIFDV